MKENNLQKAKNYAFKLLSYRARSRYEIINRLEKKGYNDKIITDVLSVLNRLDYIDDQRFAQKWVKDRINYKPRGPFLIRQELKKKGIDKSIINDVINKYFTEETELNIAKTLAKKWLQKNKNKNNYHLKLKKYLHNKGISDDIILRHF